MTSKPALAPRRARASKDVSGAPGVILSPDLVYKNLVQSSSSNFRSDIEFHEQPRQVIFGAALMILLVTLSVKAKEDAPEYGNSLKYALVGCVISIVTYAMLQSRDGLMV